VLNKYDDNQFYSNPVYVLLAYAIVKIFGMGYIQLTLLSIISSFITLIALFFWIKHLYGLKIASWAVCLLGFNYFYIMYNRLVLLETTTIMFIILSLLLFSMGKKHIAFSFLSGLMALSAFFSRTFSIMFIAAVFLTYLLYLIGERFNLVAFGDNLKRRFKYFSVGIVIPLLLWILFFALPNFENIVFHYSSRFNMASGNLFQTEQGLSITHKLWFKILPLITTMPLLSVTFIIFAIVIFARFRHIIKRVKPEEIIIFFYLLTYSVFVFFLYHHDPPRRFLYYIPFFSIYSAFALVKGFDSLKKYASVRKIKNIFIIFLLAVHFYSQIYLYLLWNINKRYDIVNSSKLIASYLKPSDVVFGETNFIWDSQCRFLTLINTNLGIPNPSFISKNPFRDKRITHIMLKVPTNIETKNYLGKRLKPEVRYLSPLCEVGVKNVRYRLYKVIY